METTSIIALSRQAVLRRKMDIVANNIANMNTAGFQAERMMFTDYLVKSRSADSVFGEKHAYVRDIASVRSTAEGSIENTNNPLDLALKGEGYFVIETEGGEKYTRNGRFQLDSEGQLVTQQGFPVLSAAGQPFFISPADKEINIARDGTVSTENGELGKIRVVKFGNEQAMRQTSGGLFTTNESPEDVGSPNVVQGALEGSNVQPVVELTRMIKVQRAYESVSKMIEKEDERIKRMLRTLSGESGG